MGIERRFMGWREAALPLAVSELWSLRAEAGDASDGARRTGGEDVWDLSPWLVVVAGARAGQHLMQRLVAHGRSMNVRLVPPAITTVGGLPEFLYRAQRPFASAWTQQLAWVRAMQAMEESALRRLLPAVEQFRRASDWLEIGQLLSRLARELGDEGLSFADVLAHGQSGSDAFPETGRWETLAELHRRYLKILDDVELWDRQTARLVALQRGVEELATDRQVVLVGTVDLGQATRRMLDQLQTRVVSLIFAPESLADRFDQHGCLVAGAWQDADIPIATEQVLLADSPLDQATALMEAIASVEPEPHESAAATSWGLESISVAIADAGLVPAIERRCHAVGQPTRWLGGISLADTLPFRFLTAASAYLERHWYVEFASLVRHPDVKLWISETLNTGQWLVDLDKFQNERLPLEVSEAFFGTAALSSIDSSATADAKALKGQAETQRSRESRDANDPASVVREAEPIPQQLFEGVARLLAPLRRSESDWAGIWQGIRQVLVVLYGDRTVDRETNEGRQLWGALKQINLVLDELLQLPEALQLPMQPAEAIRYLLSAVQRESLGLPVGQDELELMGWLDIPWDDAPHAFVVGFNEGVVPASESAELFLPDRLRSQLGLIDSSRRYARDAYAVNLLVHAKSSVHFIVGRRDSDNNPLSPSRLLFAVPMPEIGRRALSLFRDAPSRSSSVPGAEPVATNDQSTGFAIPRPEPDAPVLTELSVTRFADYLACPYRFYLNNVLRLECIDDRVDEIPSNVFGTMMHALLEDFGRSSLKNSRVAQEIEDFLNDRLDRQMARRFAELALPTVPIQLGQLRRRLAAFAQTQARRAAEGWEIWMTEVTQLRAELEIDDDPFGITGRIDRIDFHPGSGHYALLDYKSSESAKSPEATHRDKGEWINLQLPLYRHLAREIEELDGPIRLGFFVLPRDVSQVGILEAHWSEGELEQADGRAEEVVRALRARQFWPPRELPGRWEDPLGRICQVGIFDREDEGERLSQLDAGNTLKREGSSS